MKYRARTTGWSSSSVRPKTHGTRMERITSEKIAIDSAPHAVAHAPKIAAPQHEPTQHQEQADEHQGAAELHDDAEEREDGKGLRGRLHAARAPAMGNGPYSITLC